MGAGDTIYIWTPATVAALVAQGTVVATIAREANKALSRAGGCLVPCGASSATSVAWLMALVRLVGTSWTGCTGMICPGVPSNAYITLVFIFGPFVFGCGPLGAVLAVLGVQARRVLTNRANGAAVSTKAGGTNTLRGCLSNCGPVGLAGDAVVEVSTLGELPHRALVAFVATITRRTHTRGGSLSVGSLGR